MNKEDAKRLIVEGRELAVALSIDTCIFEREGFRLEQGRLKHVEQFGKFPGALLISDVVRREVLAHLSEKADASRGAFLKALSDFADYWQVTESERDAVRASLVDGRSTRDIAEQRIEGFLERCGAVTVTADGNVGVAEVLARYFEAKVPFEAKRDKKHEFPDAFALLSIEAWAKREKKAVVLVSTDGGWHAFAASSDELCCVASLDEALALFQARDSTRMRLAEVVASSLEQSNAELVAMVEHELSDSDAWKVEAQVGLNFDVKHELFVSRIVRGKSSWLESMRVIDYENDRLTLTIDFVATVDVDAEFRFFEGRSMAGTSTVLQTLRVPFKALATFEAVSGCRVELTEVELLDRLLPLKLGRVAPGHDDGESEEDIYPRPGR